MKKIMVKVLSVAIALFMLSSLVACGQKADTSGAKTDTAATAAPTEAAGTTAAKADAQPVTLTLWHMWVSDGDGNTKPFKAVLDHAAAQLKDVKLQVDGVDNESYKTKIKTAVAANEAPDIFFTWAAGFSKPFVDSGKVLALDDYLGDIKDKLLPGLTQNMTYNGKVYGLPFQMQIGALFCNKELFDNNKVKIPETYEDLVAAVKAFSAKGITPMVCGAKDKWPAMWYYDAIALKAAGAKACNEALGKKGSFDTPEFVDAAKKMDELSKMGAFGKTALGLSWDEATIAFSQGKAAMIFNGNWVAGITEGDKSGVKGKIVAVNFPAIAGGKGSNTEFYGGSGDGFMISANTKNKDAAVKTVKFLCEDMAKEAYQANAGLPGWKVQADESKISPLVKQLVGMANTATAWNIWWDVFLEGADADTHKDLVVQVMAGKMTPEQFAKEMQKLNTK